jgi:hypothetical protein
LVERSTTPTVFVEFRAAPWAFMIENPKMTPTRECGLLGAIISTLSHETALILDTFFISDAMSSHVGFAEFGTVATLLVSTVYANLQARGAVIWGFPRGSAVARRLSMIQPLTPPRVGRKRSDLRQGNNNVSLQSCCSCYRTVTLATTNPSNSTKFLLGMLCGRLQ